jgi:Fe-S oxidoreductase
MRVALLVTCLVDVMRPRIGFAALELLEAAGCEVVVPSSQACCGQPGWNSGDRAAARSLAEKLVVEFEGCDYVVAPSGSCAGMVKTHYPDLFAGEAAWMARIEALAARTYELTDFLVSAAKLGKVPGDFAGSVTCHDSCSGLRSWAFVARHPWLYAQFAMIGARVLRRMGGSTARITRLPFASGWTDGRVMPATEGRTFRELYAERWPAR